MSPRVVVGCFPRRSDGTVAGVDLEELLDSVKDARSPFGEVPGQGTPLEWLGPMSQSKAWVVQNWPAMRARVYADVLRLDSSGWSEQGQVYAPTLFHPGDGPALRAAGLGLTTQTVQAIDLMVSPKNRDDDLFTYRVMATTLVRAERLATAELAYLPASSAVTLLGGFRPDQELYRSARLPHRRMLVMFGAPMRFTSASTWWEESHVAALDRVDIAIARNNGLPESVASQRLPSNLYRNGGALAAVWLESDEDGKLLDTVGFIGFENVDGRLTLPRLTLGNLQRATLAPLVENLLCALCWGHWSIPGERPKLPDPTTREFRRLVNTSSFRRQAKSGSVDQVRLLDLRTDTVHGTRRNAGEPIRSVVAHLRRGHFRRVRVVTRDPEGRRVGSRTGVRGIDWDYQGRWIPPTVVNPQGPGQEGEQPDRVYLLPEPPSPQEYEAHRSAEPNSELEE